MATASKIDSRWRWLLLAALGLAPLAYVTWRHFYPAQVADGWSLGVYLDRIERVSALVIDGRQNLYVTQEFSEEGGTVLRYGPDGRKQVAVTKLSKPDGLALLDGGIAISQEQGRLPVLLLQGDRVTPLFVGYNVEGLASDGRVLYAIEDDKHGGRLLKYDPATKGLTALRDDLQEGEGVAVCPDGGIVYTEKKKGWVRKLQPGAKDGDVAVAEGLHDPSFLMCNHEGLWIVEDRTHLARLLLLHADGSMETVLSHLRSPQTIIALAPGRYLLAEQDRGRILEIHRTSNAKR